MDYILFDNITLTDIRTDWGVKVATGELGRNKSLIKKFRKYCDAIFGPENASIPDLDAGIGGFCPKKDRKDYLLCVTLGTEDKWGRPTFSVVGIYFSDKKFLEEFLSNSDVMGTARQVYRTDTPPSEIFPEPSYGTDTKDAGAPSELLDHFKNKTTGKVLAFDGLDSFRETAAFLAQCVDVGDRLPSIMGVTFSIDLESFRNNSFDFVFYKVDDNAPEAHKIKQFLRTGGDFSKKKSYADDSRHATDSPSNPGKRKPTLAMTIGTVTLILLFFALGLVYLSGWSKPPVYEIDPDSITATEDENGRCETNALPEDTNPGHGASESKGNNDSATTSASSGKNPPLDDLKQIVFIFEDLLQEDFTKTESYVFLNDLAVKKEYEEKKRTLIKGFEAIIDTQKNIKGANLPYFFSEKRDWEPEERFAHASEKIKDLKIDPDSCVNLKEAFWFDFESQEAPLAKWCWAVLKFEKIMKGLD